jgi:hypothetical protein
MTPAKYETVLDRAARHFVTHNAVPLAIIGQSPTGVVVWTDNPPDTDAVIALLYSAIDHLAGLPTTNG